ncbi:AAA family ATPase [Streptococcus sp. FT1-106]|uniref:AAA family ATPase n=1 Tax=Streptococcus sp. FT1-106 TaxID=3409994 RepID=UPI003BF4E9F7
MKVDLSQVETFTDNAIDFDKHVNFVFGKNGTGKSTLSRLIKEQFPEKDVRIFQGFESVISNGELNSVTLGAENVSVEKQINKLKRQIESKNVELDEQQIIYMSKVTEKQRVSDELNQIIKNINKVYIESARKIKNNSYHIAPPSYNKNDFEDELRYAIPLSQEEIKQLRENLKIEERHASEYDFIDINFQEKLDKVNSILSETVKETIVISRLDTPDKVDFADRGRHLHSKGDVCSFCGSKISDNVFEELESYFSRSEIESFKSSIISYRSELESLKDKIKGQVVDQKDFYLSNHKSVENLNAKLDVIKEEQEEFLNHLIEALTNKLSNGLFDLESPVDIGIPPGIVELQKEFHQLVLTNNVEDIGRIKKYSRQILRFSELYRLIQEKKLQSLFTDRDSLKNIINEKDKFVQEEKSKVDSILNVISSHKSKIKSLQEKTRSETKLAEDINKKLWLYVPFQLEHVPNDENKGSYKIKNKQPFDEGYREVDTLSKGEKNIIAFLYFLEKLNEIGSQQSEKIIIFDDPMDSNDDSMQYVIISELSKLIKKFSKKHPNDKLIIMTHNPHFYINVKYGRVYKEGRDRNGEEIKEFDRFIRLVKSDKTSIKIISSEGEDFKTSYEALWKELLFLYENKKPNLMLNSIRRINETFTKFNNINDFYQGNLEAQKLLNVNSHSIDDLEADLNGKTEEDLLQIMKKCFKDNNAEKHFKAQWKLAQK